MLGVGPGQPGGHRRLGGDETGRRRPVRGRLQRQDREGRERPDGDETGRAGEPPDERVGRRHHVGHAEGAEPEGDAGGRHALEPVHEQRGARGVLEDSRLKPLSELRPDAWASQVSGWSDAGPGDLGREVPLGGEAGPVGHEAGQLPGGGRQGRDRLGELPGAVPPGRAGDRRHRQHRQDGAPGPGAPAPACLGQQRRHRKDQPAGRRSRGPGWPAAALPRSVPTRWGSPWATSRYSAGGAAQTRAARSPAGPAS